MKPITIAEIAHYLGGIDRVDDPGVCVSGFATDDRQVRIGDLFIAIKGENVDGHNFTDHAVGRGAVACLTERRVFEPHIEVPNIVQALAKLAEHYRDRFQGPVVGVTGSAGKTTTKEFVAAALSPLGPVLKNEGNRNTEYTSPLVWTELTPDHKAAVIEMGMRGFGQVAHLASFTRPTIGLITNIGHSHIEMVGDREGIAKAKAELLEALPTDGWAVLWQDDDFLDLLKTKAANVRTFGFSTGDCHITHYEPVDWSSARVKGVCMGKKWEATLPAAGRHMAVNAAAAVLVAHLAGVEPMAAGSALQNATIPPMRMEIHELNGATVVLDCYNASPASMSAAIETLAELPVKGKRRAVIGEMRELGTASEKAHRDLGRELVRQQIDEVIFYGESMRFALEASGNLCFAMAESLQDVTGFLEKSKPGDVVLVKGSRALELEKALEPLEKVSP